VNAYLGWKFFGEDPGAKPIGFYLHGYKGVNPWGQMRNMGNFGSIAFAIIFG
jgi:hypothetical protein